MSRIGKTPIIIDKDAKIVISGSEVQVSGPKGTLIFVLPSGITLEEKDGVFTVITKGHSRDAEALHGFVRAYIANMVIGVTKGWSKTLELSGVGYRAAMAGANLVLTVGFSHTVTITPPTGITFSVIEGAIVVTGVDKHAVGQIAANIREVRKPEPYKGKGIKYKGEHIRKKAGKSAKGVGGATAAK